LRVPIQIPPARAGGIWIGTRKGVYRLADGRVSKLPGEPLEGTEPGLVFTLCEDREGSLWIGKSNGLWRYATGSFKHFTTRDGLPFMEVRALRETADGGLWIGVRGEKLAGGLAWQRSGVIIPIPLPVKRSEGVVALCEDRQGRLWIGLRNAGALQMSGGAQNPAFVHFTDKAGLPNDQIRALCEDREGNLWFGAENGGLARAQRRRVTALTAENGLALPSVLPILEDSRGAMWFGASCGGLNRLYQGKLTSWTAKDGVRCHQLHDGAGAFTESRASHFA